MVIQRSPFESYCKAANALRDSLEKWKPEGATVKRVSIRDAEWNSFSIQVWFDTPFGDARLDSQFLPYLFEQIDFLYNVEVACLLARQQFQSSLNHFLNRESLTV